MANGRVRKVAERGHALPDVTSCQNQSDAQLLDRYILRRDEEASPLNGAVCALGFRRVREALALPHDAEDAFQATSSCSCVATKELDRRASLAIGSMGSRTVPPEGQGACLPTGVPMKGGLVMREEADRGRIGVAEPRPLLDEELHRPACKVPRPHGTVRAARQNTPPKRPRNSAAEAARCQADKQSARTAPISVDAAGRALSLPCSSSTAKKAWRPAFPWSLKAATLKVRWPTDSHAERRSWSPSRAGVSEAVLKTASGAKQKPMLLGCVVALLA